MTQTENLIPANYTITPSSESWKGLLYDAVDKMDVASEVQEQINATESFMERFFGVSFWRLNPWERVKIMDMRRHPEEYMDVEALPILKRVENIVPTNYNKNPNPVTEVANNNHPPRLKKAA